MGLRAWSPAEPIADARRHGLYDWLDDFGDGIDSGGTTTIGGSGVDPNGGVDNAPTSLVDFAGPDNPQAGPGELGGLFGGEPVGFPQGKELFWDPKTGHIVDARGTVIMADTGPLARAIDDLQASPRDPGAIERMNKALEPVNRFLGTPSGRTLASLGLGALGFGLQQALAPGAARFRPPPTTMSSVDNPAAQRLAMNVRTANLKRLERLSDPANPTGDPVTDQLTGRLQDAMAGKISNPVLARQNTDEKNEFMNRMQRLYGSNWERDTNAQKERSTLQDSQAIRTYLDNMNTIGRFEPAQRGRIADTSNRAARDAGLSNVDADLAHRSDLASQLAYNDWVEERNRQNERARGVGSLFALAAGAYGGGRSRQPWDQPY